MENHYGESLRKENSPLENLRKVHHTLKWQKNYFITFGLLLQKANFDQKKWEKITCVMLFSKWQVAPSLGWQSLWRS